MNPDEPQAFSDQVFHKTISAVRAEQRRKHRRRVGGLTLLLLTGAAWLLRPEPTRHPEMVAESKLPEEPLEKAVSVIAVFNTDPATTRTSITTFSTKDVSVEVIRIDDDDMQTLFDDRAYGTYTAADGRRQFWAPQLVQTNL